MGREIRKVPKGWEHPKDDNGNFKPMREEQYITALNEWIKDHNLWIEGKHEDQLKRPDETKEFKYFASWDGDAPEVAYYNSFYDPASAECYQFYESVSEGTPLSPVFDSLTYLEDWLVNEKNYSREAAHNFCKSGGAPSFVMSSKGFTDGITSMG